MDICDVEIVQPEIDVSQEAVVLIDDTIDASVGTVDPIIQVNAEEYVLSSGGMYGGNAMVGAVPQWILNAVQQQLTTGDGNLTSVVKDIQALLSSLQTGVSQVVQSLNTLSTSTSSITTALQSQVNQNHSEVMNVVATKVDAAEAQAVALSAINSTFGSNVNAYIGNIASTYVDKNSAIGKEVNMLTATIGDVSARISDVSSVTVEKVLNPLWIDDGIQTDPDINGKPRYVLQAKAKKQLSVDANGVVTGLILESGATSEFTVQADKFKLVASGQRVASRNPFTVDAVSGKIDFVGVVDFTNTNLYGTTTIDGGKITTGSITANQIAAGSITADKISTTQLSSLSANLGTITAGVIYDRTWNGSTYKMKIDLNNGVLIIK